MRHRRALGNHHVVRARPRVDENVGPTRGAEFGVGGGRVHAGLLRDRLHALDGALELRDADGVDARDGARAVTLDVGRDPRRVGGETMCVRRHTDRVFLRLFFFFFGISRRAPLRGQRDAAFEQDSVGRFPRPVPPVSRRKASKLGDESRDGVAARVVAPAGAVGEKRTSENVPLVQPALPRVLPHHGVDGEVRVDERVVEPPRAVSPVDAEVVGEERRGDHAFRLVHPARAPQTAHPDVHRGEAGFA